MFLSRMVIYYEIEAILEAKNRLKQSDSLNEWIERTENTLSFCTVKEEKSRFEKWNIHCLQKTSMLHCILQKNRITKRFGWRCHKGSRSRVMGDMFKNIKI